ncbi:hypothetical protein D3C75_825640 [compost metagenome]
MPLIFWLHHPVALSSSQGSCGDILERDDFLRFGIETFFDIPGFKEPLFLRLEFSMQTG